jgi:TRAP transporter TAXI family solute receptor
MQFGIRAGMKKYLNTIRFTRFSLRDFLVTFGPALLLIVTICGLGYWLVDPTPPKEIVMSTGEENSAYDKIGKEYAAELAAQNIKLILRPSQGSQENLQRISDPDSDVEIGFVKSGSISREQAEDKDLISLGSLFYEPLWVFYRASKETTNLADFKGKRINVGPDGGGVPQLFRQILDANGIAASEVTLSALQETPATQALLAGQIDVLVLTSTSESPLLKKLLQTPGIQLFDFVQSEAYSRRFPFLTAVTLPRGIVDFGKDIPARDYHLISPTATLVAHDELHPAMLDLFVKVAYDLHGGPGWFRKQGEFPSAQYSEIPVAKEAARYYKNGPPFLQRYLNFWQANFVERMWVVLVALGALIIPLSKIIPPLYVWRIRSRIYRWYGQLRMVEQAIERVEKDQAQHVYATQMQRLADIEDKVNQISIPLSFAEQLYDLRSHIHFVRQRLLNLMDRS